MDHLDLRTNKFNHLYPHLHSRHRAMYRCKVHIRESN